MLRAARKHMSSVAMLAVAGALVVGGVAVAQDNGSGPGQSQSGKAGKPGGPPPGGMPFKGLTYGELHVQTKSGEDRVIRLDQGKVSAVSADSITVTENDGNEVTIAVDEDTEVMGKPGEETSVEVSRVRPAGDRDRDQRRGRRLDHGDAEERRAESD